MGQLFPKLYFKSSDPRLSAIKRSEDVVLRIQMLKDDLVSKKYGFASFLLDEGFELFELGFGSGGNIFDFLIFFGLLVFLFVHFVVDFEGGSRENFEEGFAIVGGDNFCFVLSLSVELVI